MPSKHILIHKEDIELWEAIVDKPQWLHKRQYDVIKEMIESSLGLFAKKTNKETN